MRDVYPPELYRDLLEELHDIEFYPVIPMDENRAEDGINLRYRFGREQNYADYQVAAWIDNRPCSVLEMMAALAIRFEESVMYDPDYDDRAHVWFSEMLDSLCLINQTDENFDADYVRSVIQDFLDRHYNRNGKGGLFTTKNKRIDMRSVEIWYQMHIWAKENT